MPWLSMAAILKFKMAAMENSMGLLYPMFLHESWFFKAKFVNFEVRNLKTFSTNFSDHVFTRHLEF